MPKQTFFNLPPAKQRNIVYAALTEFTNKGYLLGSVGTIAKNATVSKGSMYQYFEDKKEFYIYLTDYVHSMIKTTMKMQLQNYIQVDVSLDVIAAGIKEIIWNIIESYQAEICFFFSSKNEQEPEIRKHTAKLSKEFKEQIIEPILKRLILSRSIRQDIELEYLTLYCLSVLGMCKTNLLSTVNYLEEDNTLVIGLKKEEWNRIFDNIIKLAMSGLSSEYNIMITHD